MGPANPISDQQIIIFDGVCNLCNGAVISIIKADKRNGFKFAPRQSPFAKKNIGEDSLAKFDSIVLLKNGKLFFKSDAVLEIAGSLTGVWPLLALSKIFPRFLRDAVYDFIARHRYRFFGKKDQCMIPTPALKARFIS